MRRKIRVEPTRIGDVKEIREGFVEKVRRGMDDLPRFRWNVSCRTRPTRMFVRIEEWTDEMRQFEAPR